jgi:F-type H+-transporting ATPase subunit a
MKGAEFLETSHWSLTPLIGYDHPLLRINSETIIHTWIILGILCMLVACAHFLIHYTKTGRFAILQFVSFFVDLTRQSFGTFIFSHCVFAASLFVFIALCNIAPIIPWLDEPTKDLNTAVALGIIAFLYTQAIIIQHQGLRTYIAGYFKPFFIMMPLNIVSKLSSIISISFRLFGNIFGGSIITGMFFNTIRGSLIFETLFLASGINILLVSFFTLFEGVLQAFVFSMLAITYISIGIQGEGH